MALATECHGRHHRNLHARLVAHPGFCLGQRKELRGPGSANPRVHLREEQSAPHRNQAKGDKDPSNWLPQDSDVCTSVAGWISIKARWSLSMDESEFGRVATC